MGGSSSEQRPLSLDPLSQEASDYEKKHCSMRDVIRAIPTEVPQMTLRGIVNAGNQCYRISVIQAFTSLVTFWQWLLKRSTTHKKKNNKGSSKKLAKCSSTKDGCAACVMLLLANKLRRDGGKKALEASALERLQTVLKDVRRAEDSNPLFSSDCLDTPRDQHDAYDFMCACVYYLEGQQDLESTIPIPTEMMPLGFWKLYQRKLYVCPACNATRGVGAPQYGNGLLLDMLPEHSTEPLNMQSLVNHTMRGSPQDQPRCDNRSCAEYDLPADKRKSGKEAILPMKILTTPEFLTLRLQRAQYVVETNSFKIDKTQIEMSPEISLAEFAASTSVNADSQYKLQAVVGHIGQTTTSGHYIAWAKLNESWYYFNDQIVEECTLEEVMAPERACANSESVPRPYFAIYVREPQVQTVPEAQDAAGEGSAEEPTAPSVAAKTGSESVEPELTAAHNASSERAAHSAQPTVEPVSSPEGSGELTGESSDPRGEHSTPATSPSETAGQIAQRPLKRKRTELWDLNEIPGSRRRLLFPSSNWRTSAQSERVLPKVKADRKPRDPVTEQGVLRSRRFEITASRKLRLAEKKLQRLKGELEELMVQLKSTEAQRKERERMRIFLDREAKRRSRAAAWNAPARKRIRDAYRILIRAGPGQGLDWAFAQFFAFHIPWSWDEEEEEL